ncbi:zinc finger protein [Fusarium coicis]|nr:zinc finger protein [Fusarium coicis]
MIPRVMRRGWPFDQRPHIHVEVFFSVALEFEIAWCILGARHDVKDCHAHAGQFEYANGSFASAYGSMNSAYHRDRPDYQGRGNAGYSSTDSHRSRKCDPSGFGRLHHNFQFRSPADIHGDTLKKRLDQNQPLERSPARSFFSSSVNRLLSRKPYVEGPFPAALSLPAQIPIRPRRNPGSLVRITENLSHSARYPQSTPLCHSGRSTNSSSNIDRRPRTRIKGNNCDDAFRTRSSYDFAGAEGMYMEDGQSLKRLHSDDAYVPGGQKRRATSPNDGCVFSSPSDTACGRGLSSHGTMPSAPTPRPMDPTSITTADSFDPSTGGISPTPCDSPYTAPVSLDPKPQISISGCRSIHPETTPDVSTVKIIEIQMPNATEVQGFFMCECCKKPKRAHEDEKPHICSICTKRFKNKNEKVRHENSLHVRSRSWSCSALPGYDKAFYESKDRPGEADVCGYCGNEFLRSGRGTGPGALSSGNPPRHATDQDWDERTRHLKEVHKFRECNSSKKFFRADHFRQHVSHSHAGTPGMWTNMLEDACMLEENTEAKAPFQYCAIDGVVRMSVASYACTANVGCFFEWWLVRLDDESLAQQLAGDEESGGAVFNVTDKFEAIAQSRRFECCDTIDQPATKDACYHIFFISIRLYDFMVLLCRAMEIGHNGLAPAKDV